jgi:signal transduction histidine kinase
MNALRATPRGGRIAIALRDAEIRRAGGVVARALEMIVEDTGCGMSDEVRSRIFTPFFTSWGEGGGTGLGLAVVKSLIVAHGGTIDVSPRVVLEGGAPTRPRDEVGTRVVVRLPFEQARATERVA